APGNKEGSWPAPGAARSNISNTTGTRPRAKWCATAIDAGGNGGSRSGCLATSLLYLAARAGRTAEPNPQPERTLAPGAFHPGSDHPRGVLRPPGARSTPWRSPFRQVGGILAEGTRYSCRLSSYTGRS